VPDESPGILTKNLPRNDKGIDPEKQENQIDVGEKMNP